MWLVPGSRAFTKSTPTVPSTVHRGEVASPCGTLVDGLELALSSAVAGLTVGIATDTVAIHSQQCVVMFTACRRAPTCEALSCTCRPKRGVSDLCLARARSRFEVSSDWFQTRWIPPLCVCMCPMCVCVCVCVCVCARAL